MTMMAQGSFIACPRDSVCVPVNRYLQWKPADGVKARERMRLQDRNEVQLEAARECGLSRPLATREEVLETSCQLVEIRSNSIYMVDTLTYSVPYLTPAAVGLVERIGKRFQQCVRERGLGAYRMIVTSVLRTVEDVYNLRASGNRNAVVNSTHCYATTFDIAYDEFFRVGWFVDADPAELTDILVDIVEAERNKGHCFAIFERRETCIHITCRDR